MNALIALMLATLVYVDGRIATPASGTATEKLEVGFIAGGHTSVPVTVFKRENASCAGYFSGYAALDFFTWYDRSTGTDANLYYTYTFGTDKLTFTGHLGTVPYAIHAERATTITAEAAACERLTVVSNAVASAVEAHGHANLSGVLAVTNAIAGAVNSIVADELFFAETSVSNALLAKTGALSARYAEMTGESAFTDEISLDGRKYVSTAIAGGDESFTNRVEIEREGLAYLVLNGRTPTETTTALKEPAFTVAVRLYNADGTLACELGGANYLVRDQASSLSAGGLPTAEGYVLTLPVRRSQLLVVSGTVSRGTGSGGETLECEGRAGLRLIGFGGEE